MTAESNTARTGITYRPAVDETELLRLHNSGLTARQIGERLGVTPRTVVRHRAKHGLTRPTPRTSWRVTPEWLTKVAQLLDDGASQVEAARTMGCNELTVARHFPGRGWTPQESGAHANIVRRANRQFAKTGPGNLKATV